MSENRKNNLLDPALYVVSTPIGNLSDITLRALEVLKQSDYILCEDTRHPLKLLNFYNIKKKLISFHKFNEMKNIKEIVILALTSGILILLAVIIIGDYWVAVKENRTVDTEIITLMKMSITGLIGIIAGYIGGKN